MNEPLNILVTGSQGRMGMAVIDCCNNDSQVNVSGSIDVGDPIADHIDSCDVIIDFSSHIFTSDLLSESLNYGKPLVIGTTGHSDDDLSSINKASENLSIVMAPNFSIGVNTLFWLTQKTTQILGNNFDLEVVEMHHRMKIDAPSGTAKRLGEILAESRGVSYADDTVHGRQGITGQRTAKEIGMHSLRGGDVVGDHTVIYSNDGERIELTHKASSRNTFANGAIHAAKWLSGRGAGLYDMQDVLDLN
ncbi:MAG TPA: 4-hydroxy-tetrahydrodipicolinate reductase [Verrucomicrobia bacterium]|nr:4-hydroxy-tetrahydrodipicolinate reductase [Verrucomicrobiales bacterium]HIL55752.1 4-hydroxy-tetrahydrodipicolinate reductase [Verrucomicrobiota bacterium]